MKELRSDDRKREPRAGEVRVTAVMEEKRGKGHGPKNGTDGDLRIMEHFVTAFINGAEE